MKFTVSVPDLQYAMRLVRDVVPAAGPLAESTGVLISAESGRAIFTAFNPEVLTKATVKVDSTRDGEVVVDASYLYGAVSHCQPLNDRDVGTSDILVNSSPKSKKLLLSATTRYASGAETPHKRVFPLRNKEFFPDIPAFESADAVLEMLVDVLMDAIDSVSYAVSTDKNQYLLTGTLLRLEDGRLTVFATNGVCLAEYSVDVPYTSAPVEVVLPGTFAAKVSKSFFDNDTLKVSLTNNMVFVRTPNLVVAGTLIREEYPDYKEFFPEPVLFPTVNKHILLDNLVNLSYEASYAEDNRVTMSFEVGEASLRCGGSNNGGLETDFKGNITFDCNLKLFASSIRNIPGERLKIGFTDSTSPLVFMSADASVGSPKLSCVLVPLSPQ